jgi:hypothetical protein
LDVHSQAVAPEYVDMFRVSSIYFTGADVLTSLHGFFHVPIRMSSQVVVLMGLGKIGKTQIA